MNKIRSIDAADIELRSDGRFYYLVMYADGEFVCAVMVSKEQAERISIAYGASIQLSFKRS